MSMSAVHMTAHGRVQGVGFRFFVRAQAKASGVNGWARNLTDGTVEIHVEGEKEILLDFIKKIERGPAFGYVSELTIDWIEPENRYDSFNITF